MSLKILTNQSNVQAILRAMSEEVNEHIKKNQSKHVPALRELVSQEVLAQDEMQSILGGDLQGHLGIPKGQNDQAVFEIANTVSRSIEIEWKRFSPDMKTGGLKILIQPSNFADLLALRSGYVEAVHRKDGPYEMHWLSWLLKLGDTTIVHGYDYDASSLRTGRSGQGIMKKDSRFSWSIPSKYAGWDDDNFITRALTSQYILDRIENILKLILIG